MHQMNNNDIGNNNYINLNNDIKEVNTNSLHENLLSLNSDHHDDDVNHNEIDKHLHRPHLKELITREFYQQEHWFEIMCEVLFKIRHRNTTIKAECYHGIIHFISCLYCLAVVPMQMRAAGYNTENTVVAVALCSGVGSIFCGLFANLPFVLAPPTVVSIFLSVFLQQNDLGPREGNYGVMISGLCLMFVGWRPLGELIRRLIPLPIQVGTAVGIGLLTSLAGSTEINIVKAGKYTILELGKITSEVLISFMGVFIICILMRFHVKGSFCIAVIICSLTWWIHDSSYPNSIFGMPQVTTASFNNVQTKMIPLESIDLLFLYIIYLNGLLTSLSNLAVLTRADGAIPRGRWVFILSGLFTIASGYFSSAPILVSPESSAAIKEGAKTGLSTVVAGLLFLFASLFSPLFEGIPASGTSPVLIMIGVILFQNVSRIDWRNVADAAPAFIVLFYIPFTYSVIQGVILGYLMYLAITLCTGELLENTLHMLRLYFPCLESYIINVKYFEPYLLKRFSLYRQHSSMRSNVNDDNNNDNNNNDNLIPNIDEFTLLVDNNNTATTTTNNSNNSNCINNRKRTRTTSNYNTNHLFTSSMDLSFQSEDNYMNSDQQNLLDTSAKNYHTQQLVDSNTTDFSTDFTIFSNTNTHINTTSNSNNIEDHSILHGQSRKVSYEKINNHGASKDGIIVAIV